MRATQVLAASIALATLSANCNKATSDERPTGDSASKETLRANILNGSPLELPPGFTLEVAGDRYTTLQLRGRLCKTEFFDEIRKSVVGRIAKTSGFKTLECVSPDGTTTEPL